MAPKRKHSEVAGFEGMHSARQVNLGVAPKPARKKPRKLEALNSKPTSVNLLKKKIRDVSRLLARTENLAADVRIENERALEGYKQELAVAEFEKRRQKMIKKYHMVRFFERQKASRRLKKLLKQLEATTSDSEKEKLQAGVHEVEVDLNYALYCPLAEKYTSLYAPKNGSGTEGSGVEETEEKREKPPLWKEVERCMEDGTLQALRDRTAPTGPADQDAVAPPRPLKGSEKKQKGKQDFTQGKDREVRFGRSAEGPAAEDTDAESEGGFFEE